MKIKHGTSVCSCFQGIQRILKPKFATIHKHFKLKVLRSTTGRAANLNRGAIKQRKLTLRNFQQSWGVCQN